MMCNATHALPFSLLEEKPSAEVHFLILNSCVFCVCNVKSGVCNSNQNLKGFFRLSLRNPGLTVSTGAAPGSAVASVNPVLLCSCHAITPCSCAFNSFYIDLFFACMDLIHVMFNPYTND